MAVFNTRSIKRPIGHLRKPPETIRQQVDQSIDLKVNQLMDFVYFSVGQTAFKPKTRYIMAALQQMESEQCDAERMGPPSPLSTVRDYESIMNKTDYRCFIESNNRERKYDIDDDSVDSYAAPHSVELPDNTTCQSFMPKRHSQRNTDTAIDRIYRSVDDANAIEISIPSPSTASSTSSLSPPMQQHRNLLEIARKTINLLRRNQCLQSRLVQLKFETQKFVNSVMNSPENLCVRREGSNGKALTPSN